MIVEIKVEYEGESVNVALYEGIEVEEFTDVILSSLHINGSIIGLKDTNGVILLPKFICQNVAQVQQTTYELLVKPKNKSPPITTGPTPRKTDLKTYVPPKPSFVEPAPAPVQPPPRREVDPELVQITKYLRMDGLINETEEKVIHEMSRTSNPDLLSLQTAYSKTGDFPTFKSKLKQLASRHALSYPYPQSAWPDATYSRPDTSTGYRKRPISAAKWSESANINSTQAMLIGAVHDLEEKKLLDEQVVCTVKTLILEENPEVIKLLNSYIAHMIDERDLCSKLQRLSDRMSTYIERPSSPLPRKNSLLEFVNTIAATYMQNREDIELLQRLIEDENEFVLSAFDVFESDKDQENLLDTLTRIVAKFKRLGISKDSVTAASFYDGGILPQKNNLMERPETRGQSRPDTSSKARRNEKPLFSSESDSNVPGNEFRYREEPHDEPTEEKSEESEEEGWDAEAVELPAAGVVMVTRGKPKKQQTEEEDNKDEKEETQNTEPAFEDFLQLEKFDELDDETIGTFKWAFENNEPTVSGALQTYKLTNDATLLANTLVSICGKIFEREAGKSLTKEQIIKYREYAKSRSHHQILSLLSKYRDSGKLPEFIQNIQKALSTPETKPKNTSAPTQSLNGGIIKLFEARDKQQKIIPPEEMPLPNKEQEESNDENINEIDVANDILNALEMDGKLTKDEIALLSDMYKQGNTEVISGINEFKKNHELTQLADCLIPLIRKKKSNEDSAKKNKKRKYKTFEECVEFFKVFFLISIYLK